MSSTRPHLPKTSKPDTQKPATTAGPKIPEPPAQAQAQGRGVEQWVVNADYAGQRIDNFLLSRLQGVPKTRIYKMLRTGEVRVNGGRVSSDYRIEADDRLRIPPVRVMPAGEPDARHQAWGQASPAMAKSMSEKIQVLFEDELVLAINKPFGFAVHGGSGVRLGVIEALRQSRFGVNTIAAREGTNRIESGFLELVHRLDRETSGVMLIAKRRSALTEFHRQLRDGEMRKRYLALVWGGWPIGLDRIEAPLHKWVNAKGERWVRVQDGGQMAITKIQVLQRITHPVMGEVSFLRCEPLTGRTHQLRVHLAHAGCPIIGDPKYGRYAHDAMFGQQHSDPDCRWVTRMFLHAWQLRCRHPKGLERLDFRADLDSIFLQGLHQLRMDAPE